MVCLCWGLKKKRKMLLNNHMRSATVVCQSLKFELSKFHRVATINQINKLLWLQFWSFFFTIFFVRFNSSSVNWCKSLDFFLSAFSNFSYNLQRYFKEKCKRAISGQKDNFSKNCFPRHRVWMAEREADQTKSSGKNTETIPDPSDRWMCAVSQMCWGENVFI